MGPGVARASPGVKGHRSTEVPSGACADVQFLRRTRPISLKDQPSTGTVAFAKPAPNLSRYHVERPSLCFTESFEGAASRLRTSVRPLPPSVPNRSWPGRVFVHQDVGENPTAVFPLVNELVQHTGVGVLCRETGSSNSSRSRVISSTR